MRDLAINARLRKALAERNVLIMAHRGCAGSNIVDNTVESFEAAVRQGADIVEADICATLDGDLFCLHDGMEPVVLGQEESIVNMRTADVRKLRYLTRNHCRIDHPINTFDEILDSLKGRCLINLDRCWVCWERVLPVIQAHGMEDQIILKSPPERKYFEFLAAQDTPFMYMPVCSEPEEFELAESYDLNLVAVEVIGYREDIPAMEPAWLEGLKRKGYARMISSLTLGNPVLEPEKLIQKWGQEQAKRIHNRNIYLSGGHDDDVSVLGDPDNGWGWLVERGFNILQTDWTPVMSQYLQERGYNKK